MPRPGSAGCAEGLEQRRAGQSARAPQRAPLCWSGRARAKGGQRLQDADVSIAEGAGCLACVHRAPSYMACAGDGYCLPWLSASLEGQPRAYSASRGTGKLSQAPQLPRKLT